jgi:hypothetical protein
MAAICRQAGTLKPDESTAHSKKPKVIIALRAGWICVFIQGSGAIHLNKMSAALSIV